MFGAGDRMRRHEMHVRGQVRSHLAHHRALHRADIGDDRAALQVRADLGGDRAAGADRNADDDEVGVLHGFGVGLDDPVDEAELDHARTRFAERAVATISRTKPCARAARAIEPPIRPTPISARRSNRGVSVIHGNPRFVAA